MRLRGIIIIFFALVCLPAFGRLALNVSIVNEKGIDKGLSIVSELHLKINVDPSQETILEMKNGIKIHLKAYYANEFDQYGPSSKIIIENKVFDSKGNPLYEKDKSLLKVEIGKTELATHQLPEQFIEIKIQPEPL